MSRFARPVQSRELFATPEMALRHPDEIEIGSSGANEGAGRGFDNVDLSASAERIFEARCDLEVLLSWYEERLHELGWRDGPTIIHPNIGTRTSVAVERDAGESILVQWLDAWTGSSPMPPLECRITYLVQKE